MQGNTFRLIYKNQLWKIIKRTLTSIVKQQLSAEQIIEALGQFQRLTTGRPSSNKMQALHMLYHASLPKIFQKISEFILISQNKQIMLPFLQSGSYSLYNQQTCMLSSQLQLSKETAVLLVCMMATMLICNQQPEFCSEISDRNFGPIFSGDEFKTQTIIEFIKQQLTSSTLHKQRLLLLRSCVKCQFKQLLKVKQENKMLFPCIKEDGVSIEDYFGSLKVDFANQYIGGGALWGGNLQEEIMFANHPEMFVSLLLTDSMKNNQSITFIGFKKYSVNKGYGHHCTYDGQQTYDYKYDLKCRANQYITAIDAIPFALNDNQQFKIAIINREILKAYAGFNSYNIDQIITGNWGCGAFNGNIQLKFLIQWIACSMCNKNLMYAPFNCKQKMYDQQIVKQITGLSVWSAYQLMVKASKIQMAQTSSSFYTSIKKALKNKTE